MIKIKDKPSDSGNWKQDMDSLNNLHRQHEINDTFPSISAEEALTTIKNEDVKIIDVRTEAEFNGPLSHLNGAILIPVEELANRVGEIEGLKNKKILVVCRAGHRSRTASRFLSEKGFTNIINIDPGMTGISALHNAPIAKRS